MHPLNVQLEEMPHEAGTMKRRNSLDNSCLTASESARLLMEAAEDPDDANKPRRLSLNEDARISVSFLASGTIEREHQDLDMDFHKSTHGNKGIISFPGAPSDDYLSVDDWSLSDDDCESFCDGSIQDMPNREYLRRDLGGSCIWDDSISDLDLVEELEEMSLESFPEAIIEADENEEEEAPRSPVTAATANSTSSNGTTTRRVRRRSFTKKIPRVLFRSKSPKVRIRIKKVTVRDD